MSPPGYAKPRIYWEKGRQPGALQDKATAKIEALRGGKHKHKKKAAQQEMEDLGEILRS